MPLYAATRYVLSSPAGGSLQRSPDPLAGFGEGNREGRVIERAREGKGTQGEGKKKYGRGEKWRGCKFCGGSYIVIGFRGIDAPECWEL